MTAEEAEILARNTSVDCKHGIELGYPCECCVATALRAAASEARREALEEAREEIAAHPEDHILLPNVSFGLIGIDRARDRIRALAEKDH